MIKKKKFANTPDMKKLSHPTESRIFTAKKNHYASISITVVEFFQTTYTPHQCTSSLQLFPKKNSRYREIQRQVKNGVMVISWRHFLAMVTLMSMKHGSKQIFIFI